MSQQDELRNRFDTNNTDKYYRSGAPSVFAGQPVDSTTLKPGDTIAPGPPTNNATLADLDERNTDKYYRSKDRKPTPQQVAAVKHGRPGGARVKIGDVPVNGMATVVSRVPGQLMLTDVSEIDSIVHSAVNQVLSGPVAIHVFGDSALVMRLRTRLEMMVTRETITEDQYRDINIYGRGPAQEMLRTVPETRTPNEIYGVPVASGEGRDTPMLTDPMDFLKGADVEEEVLPDAPPPVEVAETDDFLQPEESGLAHTGPILAAAHSGPRPDFLSTVTQPTEAAEVEDLFDLPPEEKKIEPALPPMPAAPAAAKKDKKDRQDRKNRR